MFVREKSRIGASNENLRSSWLDLAIHSVGQDISWETWSRKLGWDDPLPANLCNKWSNFVSSLFKLHHLCLERCLRPTEAMGLPWLIVQSDGSDLAYGFAAYIRWKLEDGRFWCRLIMAKCRVAPMNKLSTSQMELNAAVLSKRGRKVIEKEVRFDFERVLQIVDSETVLIRQHEKQDKYPLQGL